MRSLLSLQVKIWFQNKRSKFKKLMKQGGGTIDANALATGRGLSSGSPSVAPVWSSPTTVKTSVGTTGSYIPSYTSWYPTTHQESMQQSQLMWREQRPQPCRGSCIRMLKGPCSHSARPSRRWYHTTTTPELAAARRQLTQWPPHTGWRRAMEWKTERARNAPEGNKSMTVSGKRRQMDPFIGCCLSLLCQFLFSFLFKKIIFVWVILFIKKHVFVYARCSGPRWWRDLKPIKVD